MVILWETGDQWRLLSWEEYKAARQRDGNFSDAERRYFDRVVRYCQSAETANQFCPNWAKQLA
jgi:hypothetical protein